MRYISCASLAGDPRTLATRGPTVADTTNATFHDSSHHVPAISRAQRLKLRIIADHCLR